jgi:hypothetical protein
LNDVRVTPIAVDAGGRQVTGLQLTGTETAFAPAGNGPSPSVQRWLMFADGRAVVSLRDAGEPHAPAPATERRLLTVLLRRAAGQPAP